MKLPMAVGAMLDGVMLGAVAAAPGQTLKGKIGVTTEWKSAWLDLERPRTFKSWDRIRLILGGDAERVVVRLLGQDQDPNEPVGIVVPGAVLSKGGVVEV